VSACARLADTIELSLRAGRFPLILGGDHSLAMGSVAGLVRHFRPRGKHLGVLWVDAHADMNTPETSPSGCLHGMPLATLLGRGPDVLTQLCGGSPALDPDHVVLFGVRDVDAEEELVLQHSGVRVFRRTEIARRGVDACLTEALDRLRAAGAGIHLSFDLDACDPSLAPGVTTPVHRG
jgi:arginase